MFECQIFRTISQPMSILLAIKAYPFGLAPRFFDTYGDWLSLNISSKSSQSVL
jgi:hypothetical protein